MNHKREHAKRLMRHYLGGLARASGLPVGSDWYAEIDDLVDFLVDAAKDEIRVEAQENELAQHGRAYDTPVNGSFAHGWS